MSSLYRKYRPQRFSDLIGQDHIRASIEGMLKNDQINHAFLFSGPRGTGKTTLARLLARSLNCVGKKDSAEACGKCEICLEIQNNQSVDIIEIDAASNRGIDEIRDLREKVAFAPARNKYKVYIVDEFHMLTKEAFNALLKTLEEPPSHVIFILATTELHKVPETVISRCLRYQFHRASSEDIVRVLGQVAKKEGLKLDQESLNLLAERAEGSFRDALTLLSNVSSSPDLNIEAVRTLIGLPPSELITQSLQAILGGSTRELADLLRDFLSEGGDMSVLTRTLANACRERLFAMDNADIVEHAALLEELLVALAKARHSTDSTSLLCGALISLTIQRATERAPTNSQPVSSGTIKDIVAGESPSLPIVDSVTAVPVPAPVSDQGHFWTLFLEAIKDKNHALYAVARAAKFEGITEDKLLIAVKFRFYSERLFEPKNRDLIESLAAQIAGRKLTLECLVKTGLDERTGKEEDLLSTAVEVFELDDD